MQNELKPCPFCSKPVSMVYNSFEKVFKIYHENGNDEENCCIEGEIRIKGVSFADATEKWNKGCK